MITAQDLTKRYGDRTVVTGLSFTVRPGNASALDTVAGTPSPGVSLLALCLWAFGTVAVAAVLLKRRDV